MQNEEKIDMTIAEPPREPVSILLDGAALAKARAMIEASRANHAAAQAMAERHAAEQREFQETHNAEHQRQFEELCQLVGLGPEVPRDALALDASFLERHGIVVLTEGQVDQPSGIEALLSSLGATRVF